MTCLEIGLPSSLEVTAIILFIRSLDRNPFVDIVLHLPSISSLEHLYDNNLVR